MGLVFFSGSFTTGSDGDIDYNSAVQFASINSNSTSEAIEIKINSQSLGTSDNVTALFISASGTTAKLGIGNSEPLTSLDIRSTTSSAPANIILRTNEDGIVQSGEETGRIIFAIESASYNFGGGLNFVSSGSTAAIFSRVLTSSSLDTNHGSLIFEVNDSSNNTQPIEILTLGHGLPNNDVTRGGIFTQTNRPVALLSASLIIDDNDGPFIHIRGGTNTGNPYRIADLGVITETASELISAISDNFDRGSLKLFHNSSSKVDLNSYGSTDFIDTGKNLGIGTQTSPEKLTVEGSISASGDIIGTINGGTF
tara:strand:- start:11989 stop:12921 length:933 start_codon:yes stop_codon:yes gene_type:complete